MFAQFLHHMKSLRLLIILLLCILDTTLCEAQDSHSFHESRDNVIISIDERLELACIAFRLAGAEEYQTSFIPNYSNTVDEYFSSYKNHKLIHFINDIRSKYNFAYSVPAKAALMTEIQGDRIVISENVNIPLEISMMPDCWDEDIFIEYIQLLNSFYTDSDFNNFFISNEKFYKSSLKNSSDIVSRLDMKWFQDFFGKEPKLTIYLGPLLASANYSLFNLSENESSEINIPIYIGLMEGVDDSGSINDLQIPIIVHEMSHYYTRQLVDKCYDQISSSMEFVYSNVREQMLRIGYGSARAMTGEWFNELFVNIYLSQDQVFNDNRFYVAGNVNVGYWWMRRAVQFMDNFLYNRDKYASLDDFIPQLIAFTNNLPDSWKNIENEFYNREPYIINTFPQTEMIDNHCDKIKVTFSEPMITSIRGLMKTDGYDMLPINFTESYWEDNRTFVISVKIDEVEIGNYYSITLPQNAFLSENYHSINENYELIVKYM